MEKQLEILVVDDDEVDRMAVRRSLKSAGFLVNYTEAETCREALEKLSARTDGSNALPIAPADLSLPPAATRNSIAANQIFDSIVDCVFLDYRLPDGDGLTLVQAIRKAGIKIPLIVLTGQGDEQIAVELMKAGASDYIAKSKMSADSLSRSLQNALRVYRAETQALLANQQLKETEERYRLVLEAVNDGIWDWDLTTNEVYWNDRLLEIIGLQRSQFGNTMDALYDRLHPKDREEIIRAIEAHLQEEIDYNVEFRLLHSCGSYRHCISQGKAQRNSRGKPLRMAGTIGDITDRKQAEVALERERQQLKQIITQAPVAMAMFDTEMRYTANSHKWLTQFNLGWQSLINISHYELFPDTPHRWKVMHAAALKGEPVSVSEDVWERADGSVMYLRWAAHPWYNSEGQVGGIVMVADKINELVEARETALEASRVKSQFLANMSHEIRTPMNGVLGMAQLLLHAPLEPKQREDVQTIYRSAEHLLSVINDILDFSKIEAGEMRLEQANFDLNCCIESVIDMVAPLAEEKGIELSFVVDSGVPHQLVGDCNRLKQILLNLTGNAIKFTDRGQVLVRVTVKREARSAASKQATTLLFAVRDTGIGISLEGQRKLFQSFSQVDGSSTREHGGTGLGLAICKQLVEMMAGEIGVRSVPGEGSNFWFAIPLEKQLPIEPQHPELAGKKLLIVAGNALARAAVRSLAKTWGLHCDEAETIAEASSILEKANSASSQDAAGTNKCWDAVLVDLQMPDLDAAEFALKVRTIPTVGSLIALTALAAKPEAEALCDRGFSSYLLKPLRASRLLEVLLLAVKETGEIDGCAAGCNCDLPAVKSPSAAVNYPNSLKILLAEDHPINQQVILEQLAVLGYQADCAANGQEALDLLAANSYDLVLMDCQMPVLDGYETTQKLREIEGSDRHTFAIALTAHAMPGEREKCLAAGMDDYLSKPVNLEALAGMLKKYEAVNRQSENNSQVTTINLETKCYCETEPAGVLATTAVSGVALPEEIKLLNAEDAGGLFDRSRLEQLGRVNIKLPQRLLQGFLESAKTDLEFARIALNARNWQALADRAHRLKGTSANVGIPMMSDLAAQLEDRAGSIQEVGEASAIVQVENILTNLLSYLARVREFIENMG